MNKKITDMNALESVMTTPSEELCTFVSALSEPLLVLGAGGKMGPSLCVMAKRALRAVGNHTEVIAVSRFSNPESLEWLHREGVKTLACDLLDNASIRALPETKHVIYLVGTKFGTTQNPAFTWIINTLVPSAICQQFPTANIVALSTGNVYPFVATDSGGSLESDTLAPVGEYGFACLARERLFAHYAATAQTNVALIRLNYAIDLQYGVLLDIAQKVYNNRPIDISTGFFNCIWQRDANDMIIRSLSLATSPANPLNLTGKEVVSLVAVAKQFGLLFQKDPIFEGEVAPTALLSNATKIINELGEPSTSLDDMIAWTAQWVEHGGKTIKKPTHFQVRDGKF